MPGCDAGPRLAEGWGISVTGGCGRGPGHVVDEAAVSGPYGSVWWWTERKWRAVPKWSRKQLSEGRRTGGSLASRLVCRASTPLDAGKVKRLRRNGVVEVTPGYMQYRELPVDGRGFNGAPPRVRQRGGRRIRLAAGQADRHR